MSDPRKLPARNAFGRVREAREALRDKASEILEAYLANAKEAQAAQEFETASKALQWLMEHMPADEETGEKLVDTSVDKQAKQIEKNTMPSIQIGFALGGLPQTAKALPKPKVEVIEVEDE